MTIETREMYASPNGDRWYLARQLDSQQVFIRHVANAPSGGHVDHIELGVFLTRRGNMPEQQALLRLIGTLTEGRSDADPAQRRDPPEHE
ncbi:MAG TPA: hypothetical protein VHH13_03575 [Arthrobacter sp.]|nr:hypothetical protein [Arthrobacter sp.]